MNIFRSMASIAIILPFVFGTWFGIHLKEPESYCPDRCQKLKGGENVIKGGERSKFYYFSQTRGKCRQATGTWTLPSQDENRFSSKQECHEACGNCLPKENDLEELGFRAHRPKNDIYFGCYKGYCWSACTSIIGNSFDEWCYSTRSYSQSFDYVRCNSTIDCGYKNWHCAGSCTV